MEPGPALYKVAKYYLPIFELLIALTALDDAEKQPSLYDHAPVPRCNDVGTQTHQQVATLIQGRRSSGTQVDLCQFDKYFNVKGEVTYRC